MTGLLATSAALLAAITLAAGLVGLLFRRVEPGKALIVSTSSSTEVILAGGRLLLPIVHRAEQMDLSAVTFALGRTGGAGLMCKDGVRVDIELCFSVRVNPTEQDVLEVAQVIGCDRAIRRETVEQLFSARFSEALETVGGQLDSEEVLAQREELEEEIIEVIGHDLNGYRLEEVAVLRLEQTPVEALDEHNILDARGLAKLKARATELQRGG